MKYQLLFLNFIFLSIFQCNSKKEILTCDILNELHTKDQFYRIKHENLFSPYFYLMDSLVKSKGIPGGYEHKELLTRETQDTLKRIADSIIRNGTKPDQSILDSIWKLQAHNDYQNTTRILSMIKHMGLKNMDTLKCNHNYKSLFCLVHCPDELKEETRKLIDPELKSIDSFRYKHLMWHLNGRNMKQAN